MSKHSIDWSKLSILITGGTGSFGKAFTGIMLKKYRPKVLRIFSRDELKQHEMRLEGYDAPCLRYFIGDVRDKNRLERAVQGIDIIVHAAALKQVLACEYNPFEAVKTNILGAQNVIEAAIDNGVEKIIALSTDKAVNPVNLYGATKLCAEKIFIQANSYVGTRPTRLSCARYGNVLESRGSVVPLFKKQKESGQLTITDRRMTRFWITLEQSVGFIIRCIEMMRGGEIFVPKIPSMRIVDLAEAIAPNCRIKEIGILPGEKINEVLLTKNDARHSLEFKDFFVIEPERPWWKAERWKGGKRLPADFEYRSDNNTQWLSKEDLKKLI